MGTNEYYREWKRQRREAGYVGFMLFLTPSAVEALKLLLRRYPEMSKTDIVCDAIKAYAEGGPSNG